MFTEEEVELTDLVAQTLELNGCLPKIKAQLRANLFLALDDDSKICKQQPLLNSKVKSYLQKPEGQLMFSLVREFLEYFNLDFTASVYEPESYVGSYYRYEGRDKIIEDLGLKSTEDNLTGPVLLQVMKIAQTKSKTLKINLTNMNGDDKKESNDSSVISSIHEKVNGHVSEGENNSSHKKSDEPLGKKGSHINGENKNDDILDSTYVKNNAENDDTFNGTSSIEEESVNGLNNNGDISQKSSGEETVSSNEQETSPKSEDKTKSTKSDKLKTKLELPPLQLNKSPRGSDLLPSLYSKEFKEKSNKEYDFEIKDDYEEDFMSGSELELSQNKRESPKPLFDELQQCSEYTSNCNSIKSKMKLMKSSTDSSNSSSENRNIMNNSTDNTATNSSVNEDVSVNSKSEENT